MSADLYFDASLNGGAYANKCKLTSAGALALAGSLTTSTNISSSSGYLLSKSSAVVAGNSDLSIGLGTTDSFYGSAGRPTALFGQQTDGANNVVVFVAYNAAAASITNAATMRALSAGWCDNGPTYAELSATMCDGSFISGAQKARVAESATAQLARHVGSGTAGTASACGSGTAGTASACAAITAGMITYVMTETLSPSAVETNMTNTVPAGSLIRAVIANCETALTGGGTTVTWSVGTVADPDKYGSAGYPTQADSLAQNSKSNWIGAQQITTTAETITLTGTATGGDADGNTALTNGSVKIMVIYDTYDAIPNA
jgi:hypothetical protein